VWLFESAVMHALFRLLTIGVILGLVSRLLLARWLVGGLLAPAGRYFRALYQIFRTPGNIVHELAHAVGYWISGYRVTTIRFWFNDPDARGYVQAGAPYAPWGRPWLARLLASPAPLLAGALVLQLTATWLEVPQETLGLLWQDGALTGNGPQWSHVGEAVVHWARSPLGGFKVAGFFVLALSIGVETAPSGTDCRILAQPLLFGIVLLLAAYTLAYHWPPALPAWRWIAPWLEQAFLWLAEPLAWATVALLVVTLVLTPMRLLISGFRR